MSQISIEGFYPLLILAAGALIRTLQKKAKEKKDREGYARPNPPSSPIIMREVSQPKLPIKTLGLPQVKMSMTSVRKRKKPRIGKLISELKHKQDLILLSEILVNKHSIK